MARGLLSKAQAKKAEAVKSVSKTAVKKPVVKKPVVKKPAVKKASRKAVSDPQVVLRYKRSGRWIEEPAPNWVMAEDAAKLWRDVCAHFEAIEAVRNSPPQIDSAQDIPSQPIPVVPSESVDKTVSSCDYGICCSDGSTGFDLTLQSFIKALGFEGVTVGEAELIRLGRDMIKLLVTKNRNYGGSVTEPVNIFKSHEVSVIEAIRIRLDDKLARVKHSLELRRNDIADIIGYCFLLLRELKTSSSDFFRMVD